MALPNSAKSQKPRSAPVGVVYSEPAPFTNPVATSTTCTEDDSGQPHSRAFGPCSTNSSSRTEATTNRSNMHGNRKCHVQLPPVSDLIVLCQLTEIKFHTSFPPRLSNTLRLRKLSLQRRKPALLLNLLQPALVRIPTLILSRIRVAFMKASDFECARRRILLRSSLMKIWLRNSATCFATSSFQHGSAIYPHSMTCGTSQMSLMQYGQLCKKLSLPFPRFQILATWFTDLSVFSFKLFHGD